MFLLDTSKLPLLHFFTYFLKNRFIHSFINLKKRLFDGTIYWNGVYLGSDHHTFTYQHPNQGATLGYEDNGSGGVTNFYVGLFDEVSAFLPIFY